MAVEAIALTISAIGLGIQALSAIDANAKQKVATNAQVGMIEEQTAKQLSDFRDQGEAIKSRQAAFVGASGVKVEGSPLMVMQETARQLEEDAAWIKRQGELAVDITRKEGNAAEASRMLDTASTLLTGGFKLYDSFSANYGSQSRPKISPYRYSATRRYY